MECFGPTGIEAEFGWIVAGQSVHLFGCEAMQVGVVVAQEGFEFTGGREL